MADVANKEDEEQPDAEGVGVDDAAEDDGISVGVAPDGAGDSADEPASSESTEEGDDSSEEADEPLEISPREKQRRIRRRHMMWAIVLTAVFVTIVVYSSGVLHPRRDQDLLAIAPSVLFENLCTEVAKENGTKLHVADFEVTDSMIPQIVELKSIDTFIVDQGKLTDRAMIAISALPNLRHLRLRLSPISDEGLETIAQCESLWYLNLPHVDCTPEGVASLAQLPRLRQLRLGSTELGNEVTNSIAKIESLRGIHLIGVAVTDEGLKTLAAMPHLESLYLDDSKVTEAGWMWLFKNYPQLHVHIDQEHHDYDPHAHQHHE